MSGSAEKVSGGHGGQKLEHKTSRCSSVIMVNLALVMCIMKITSSRHRGDYSPRLSTFEALSVVQCMVLKPPVLKRC